MAATMLFLLAALTLAATSVHARPVDPARHPSGIVDMQAVGEFTTGVNQYVALRRLLEDPLSRRTLWAEPEQAALAPRAQRAMLLEARGAVQPGYVFTSRASAYFRRQIQVAERNAGVGISGLWSVFLLAVPELPKELEYRVAGRDLVLLDPENNLVVDVLEAAFSPEWAGEADPGLDESETCGPEDPPFVDGSPCDTHSELKTCWS